MSEVRVVGRVRTEGTPLWFARLEHGEVVAARWLARRNFVVESEDGPVRVELGRSVALEPLEEHDGRWRDLESRAEAAPFRSTGPAPHAKATLSVGRVGEGDLVTVVGTLLEERFDDATTHRQAPEARVARMRADRVVLGEAAKKPKKPKKGPTIRSTPRWPLQAWFFGAVTLATLALFGYVFATEGTTTAAASSLPILALSLAAIGTAWTRGARRATRFVHRESRVDVSGRVNVGFGAMIFTAVLMMSAFVFWDFAGETGSGTRVNNQDPVLICACLLCGMALAFTWLTERKSMRLAKILLAAPAKDGPEVGVWSRVVGRVEDPTPVLGGEAAMAMSTKLEWTDGSGDHNLEELVQSDDTFFVKGDGWELEVFANEGYWATDVRRIRDHGAFESWKVPVDGSLLLSTELIPIGASLVVAGRPSRGDDGLAVKSVGEESLVFYATDGGEDPVARLRGTLASHRLVLGFLAACWVGAAAISFGMRSVVPEGVVYLPDD